MIYLEIIFFRFGNKGTRSGSFWILLVSNVTKIIKENIKIFDEIIKIYLAEIQ